MTTTVAIMVVIMTGVLGTKNPHDPLTVTSTVKPNLEICERDRQKELQRGPHVYGVECLTGQVTPAR